MNRAGDVERKGISGDHLMEERLRRSSRRRRDLRALGKERAHPGRPSPQPSGQVPPSCPTFVADPVFREIASVRVYGRNATIARQGDPARYAYVLRRGLIQVSSLTPSGKHFTDLMGPGSVLGIRWILSDLPQGLGLTAITECEVDQVEAQRFLKYLEDRPGAALELLRHLSRQEVQHWENLIHLSAKVPSGERLMSALVELGRIYGVPAESGLRIPVPLTVQMLADKIGCSRQWASRLLRELEAAGKLKRNRGWITLINGAGRSY